jgi:hypothetical protein
MAKPRAALGIFDKSPVETIAPVKTEESATRTDRTGKAAMPFWIPIAAKKQLRIMAAEQETTQQQLIADALNDLFKKYGKPPIA